MIATSRPCQVSRVHPLFKREERAVLHVSSESVHAEFLKVPLFPGQEHGSVRNSLQEEWIRAVEERHVDIFTREGPVELAEYPGVEASRTENPDIQVAPRMGDTFHAGAKSHDERDTELPSECIELLLLGRSHFHQDFIIKGSCIGVKGAFFHYSLVEAGAHLREADCSEIGNSGNVSPNRLSARPSATH